VDTAANPTDGEARVRDLMKREGVSEEAELGKSKDIYRDVLRFLENTGFGPPLRPAGKY
jgi:hypothetical protein